MIKILFFLLTIISEKNVIACSCLYLYESLTLQFFPALIKMTSVFSSHTGPRDMNIREHCILNLYIKHSPVCVFSLLFSFRFGCFHKIANARKPFSLSLRTADNFNNVYNFFFISRSLLFVSLLMWHIRIDSFHFVPSLQRLSLTGCVARSAPIHPDDETAHCPACN